MNEFSSQSVRRIAARESGTNAPWLKVGYRVGPELRVDLSDGILTLAFNAETNRTYAIEFRTTWDSGQWEIRTNFPLQTAPTVLRFSEVPVAVSRFYRVSER